MKNVFLTIAILISQFAVAQSPIQPNIMVIFGNNIGYNEWSIYNKGKLGFKTPNIDRLASQGGYFANYYAQQTALAGQAAFMTGQSPIRTGLLKEDSSTPNLNIQTPTLASFLKNQGYATYQIGKGQVEKNLFHGFDQIDKSKTNKELIEKTKIAIGKCARDRQPFFIWYNAASEQDSVSAKNKEFDAVVGDIVKKMDELKLSDNTIIIVTTDNGAEIIPYGDGDSSSNLGERNTYFEARYRVPAVIRWTSVVLSGTFFKGIVSHEDWLPTLATAAGVTHLKQKLLARHTNGQSTAQAHLDGYDLYGYLSLWTENPRKEFFYWTENGDLGGLRYEDRKLEFMRQLDRPSKKQPGLIVPLKHLMIVNQSEDANPYDLSEHEPGDIYSYLQARDHLLKPAKQMIEKFSASFSEFPPIGKSPQIGTQLAIKKIDQSLN